MLKKSILIIICVLYTFVFNCYGQNYKYQKSQFYFTLFKDISTLIAPKGVINNKLFSINQILPKNLLIGSKTDLISTPTIEVSPNKNNPSTDGKNIQKDTIKKEEKKNTPIATLDVNTAWWTTAGIILIFGILIFIGVASYKQKITTEALGLPSGSIRAIIALLLLFFLMLMYVMFFLNANNTDAIKQISTEIFGLLSTVVGFYFGSKATEKSQQGQQNPQDQQNPKGQQNQI